MKPISISKLYFSTKDYLNIILGTFIFSFGFTGFILSNEIVPGGLSGICSLLYFSTKIPVSVSYFVINIALLAIAYKVLGLKFLIRTLYGVVWVSISLTFFEWLLGGKPIIPNDPFMAIVIGSFLSGTGLGMIFAANGSTGGTDIIGAIVNKYKDISIGRAMLFCDFIIICSSFLIFHDIEKIVYGFVDMIICNLMIDRVINSNRRSVQFLIFSSKYEEITQHIIHDLGRGCTLLNGEGGFSGNDTKVIVLLAKASESGTIFRLIKSIDHNAFISQSIVRGVYGEGFDQIKT